MSEIGDELRKVADEWDVTPLYALADRIDAEMAELPRGKDGRPILAGETVYGEDGRAWHVRGVTIGEKSIAHPEHVIRATSDAEQLRYLKPEWLTHECPDSWSRIADELDEWRFEHMRDLEADGLNDMSLFADRIRRLAKERGHEHE